MHLLGGFTFGMAVVIAVSLHSDNDVITSTAIWFAGWLFYSIITTCNNIIRACRSITTHIRNKNKDANGNNRQETEAD